MRLLVHEAGGVGQVGLPPTERPLLLPERTYHYTRFLVVEHADLEVEQYDATEIARLPGFREATPQEYNQYQSQHRARGALREKKRTPAG